MTDDILQPKKRGKKAKITKFVFFVVFIFTVSGISSVLTEKYIFPWLATRSWLEKQIFFRKAMENVTVINKTEQITVNESQTISGYTEKSASSVVEIVSKQKGIKNAFSGQRQSVSGIIVAADGLVASFDGNFFDDPNAAQYEIFTQDGKTYAARIAAIDPFSNIVLLKMENAGNLPVAEFIAVEDIKTGMKTAAIGRSGFNAEISLRLGITSEWAKNYSISGPLASSEKLQGVLMANLDSNNKTDEALTGGAAVDQNGNVVGILGERKEDAGVGFFIIPVNHLRYVVDQYLGKGKIERATLGIYYAALSRETAYLAENNFDRGALVYSPSGQQGLAVLTGSPADKAGIKIGDIALNVNGEEVNPDQNLAYLISKYKPGDSVELKIVRDGREMSVKATLQ